MQQIKNLADAQNLALAVVDAIAEPFVVLDDQLRLVAASRSFYDSFSVDPETAHGQSLFQLCDAAWDLVDLRKLLQQVVVSQAAVDGFELDVDFRSSGLRSLLLNARVVTSPNAEGLTILLAMKDISIRRKIEREKQALLAETTELLRQQRLLLEEMHHRVANSLQIVASILMLKARSVNSKETHDDLIDAQQRVISVAEVQGHLHAIDGIDQINVRDYLTKLCAGLASSMTGPANPIATEVAVTNGSLASSQVVSLGLIITELVINAIKYAFPAGSANARILVSYEDSARNWRLEVSDNGIGKQVSKPAAGGGLGTAIVAALTKQLGGQIDTLAADKGLTVRVTGTHADALPLAA